MTKKGEEEIKQYIRTCLNKSKRPFLMSDTNKGLKVVLLNFGLSYILEFIEDIGWCFYIQINDDDVYELDFIPDYDYQRIEAFIDKINYRYYTADTSSEVEFESNLKRLDAFFDEYKQRIKKRELLENKYVIGFKPISGKTPVFTLTFSPILNFWELETENITNGGGVHDALYDCFQGCEDLLYEINETNTR